MLTCGHTQRFLIVLIHIFYMYVHCFSVLDKDLAIWRDKGGITEDVFKTALTKGIGNHYQIIKHKLYRSKKCMFASRWATHYNFKYSNLPFETSILHVSIIVIG